MNQFAFAFGDELAFIEVVAEGPVGGLCEADAGGGDFGAAGAAERFEARVFGDENGGIGGAEVNTIVGAIDLHGYAEFAGAAGEVAYFRHGAILLHPWNSPAGFDGADEDGFGFINGAADGVEAVVESVNEVNVGMAGLVPHDAVASGASDVGVAGWVVFDVSFGFNDFAAGKAIRALADEEMTEKARGNDFSTRFVKGAVEGFEVFGIQMFGKYFH